MHDDDEDDEGEGASGGEDDKGSNEAGGLLGAGVGTATSSFATQRTLRVPVTVLGPGTLVGLEGPTLSTLAATSTPAAVAALAAVPTTAPSTPALAWQYSVSTTPVPAHAIGFIAGPLYRLQRTDASGGSTLGLRAQTAAAEAGGAAGAASASSGVAAAAAVAVAGASTAGDEAVVHGTGARGVAAAAAGMLMSSSAPVALTASEATAAAPLHFASPVHIASGALETHSRRTRRILTFLSSWLAAPFPFGPALRHAFLPSTAALPSRVELDSAPTGLTPVPTSGGEGGLGGWGGGARMAAAPCFGYPDVHALAGTAFYPDSYLSSPAFVHDSDAVLHRMQALGTASSWLGSVLEAGSWADAWVLAGLSGYLVAQYLRAARAEGAGDKEYRLEMARASEAVAALEDEHRDLPALHPLPGRGYGSNPLAVLAHPARTLHLWTKAPAVMHMLAMQVGELNFQRAVRLMVATALSLPVALQEVTQAVRILALPAPGVEAGSVGGAATAAASAGGAASASSPHSNCSGEGGGVAAPTLSQGDALLPGAAVKTALQRLMAGAKLRDDDSTLEQSPASVSSSSTAPAFDGVVTTPFFLGVVQAMAPDLAARPNRVADFASQWVLGRGVPHFVVGAVYNRNTGVLEAVIHQVPRPGVPLFTGAVPLLVGQLAPSRNQKKAAAAGGGSAAVASSSSSKSSASASSSSPLGLAEGSYLAAGEDIALTLSTAELRDATTHVPLQMLVRTKRSGAAAQASQWAAADAKRRRAQREKERGLAGLSWRSGEDGDGEEGSARGGAGSGAALEEEDVNETPVVYLVFDPDQAWMKRVTLCLPPAYLMGTLAFCSDLAARVQAVQALANYVCPAAVWEPGPNPQLTDALSAAGDDPDAKRTAARAADASAPPLVYDGDPWDGEMYTFLDRGVGDRRDVRGFPYLLPAVPTRPAVQDAITADFSQGLSSIGVALRPHAALYPLHRLLCIAADVDPALTTRFGPLPALGGSSSATQSKPSKGTGGKGGSGKPTGGVSAAGVLDLSAPTAATQAPAPDATGPIITPAAWAVLTRGAALHYRVRAAALAALGRWASSTLPPYSNPNASTAPMHAFAGLTALLRLYWATYGGVKPRAPAQTAAAAATSGGAVSGASVDTKPAALLLDSEPALAPLAPQAPGGAAATSSAAAGPADGGVPPPPSNAPAPTAALSAIFPIEKYDVVKEDASLAAASRSDGHVWLSEAAAAGMMPQQEGAAPAPGGKPQPTAGASTAAASSSTASASPPAASAAAWALRKAFLVSIASVRHPDGFVPDAVLLFLTTVLRQCVRALTNSKAAETAGIGSGVAVKGGAGRGAPGKDVAAARSATTAAAAASDAAGSGTGAEALPPLGADLSNPLLLKAFCGLVVSCLSSCLQASPVLNASQVHVGAGGKKGAGGLSLSLAVGRMGAGGAAVAAEGSGGAGAAAAWLPSPEHWAAVPSNFIGTGTGTAASPVLRARVRAVPLARLKNALPLAKDAVHVLRTVFAMETEVAFHGRGAGEARGADDGGGLLAASITALSRAELTGFAPPLTTSLLSNYLSPLHPTRSAPVPPQVRLAAGIGIARSRLLEQPAGPEGLAAWAASFSALLDRFAAGPGTPPRLAAAFLRQLHLLQLRTDVGVPGEAWCPQDLRVYEGADGAGSGGGAAAGGVEEVDPKAAAAASFAVAAARGAASRLASRLAARFLSEDPDAAHTLGPHLLPGALAASDVAASSFTTAVLGAWEADDAISDSGLRDWDARQVHPLERRYLGLGRAGPSVYGGLSWARQLRVGHPLLTRLAGLAVAGSGGAVSGDVATAGWGLCHAILGAFTLAPSGGSPSAALTEALFHSRCSAINEQRTTVRLLVLSAIASRHHASHTLRQAQYFLPHAVQRSMTTGGGSGGAGGDEGGVAAGGGAAAAAPEASGPVLLDADEGGAAAAQHDDRDRSRKRRADSDDDDYKARPVKKAKK